MITDDEAIAFLAHISQLPHPAIRTASAYGLACLNEDSKLVLTDTLMRLELDEDPAVATAAQIIRAMRGGDIPDEEPTGVHCPDAKRRLSTLPPPSSETP